jgi:predicted MPP superfamily phosphohydrolase
MPLPSPTTAVDHGRRDFLKFGATGLTVFALGNPLGNFSGDDEYEVVYKTVKLPRLPKEIRGFRIAMIADIHSGPYMSKSEIDSYVARINALKPDAILLPGDFVQNRNEEIEPVCDALAKLEARHGVYGSTGNHDYFADADYISKELEHAGVRMLRNEHVLIEVKGKEIALVGLDDIGRGREFEPLFRRAVEGLDARLPNIVLCHKPYYLEEASAFGAGLMVSGHTHGGQIVLARIFGAVVTPASLISGYVEGLYRLDRTQLYVTRGIGVVGIPLRVNCPPEITVLTLV